MNDRIGIRLLTRLRLGCSHWREHKFRHNFKDILNPLWSCSISTLQATLTDVLRNTDSDLSSLSDDKRTNVLLYGNQKYDDQ